MNARTIAAYTAASLLTAVVAVVASIPFTGPAVTAVTIDAAVLVGLPTLHAANRRAFHRTTSNGDS